MLYGLRCGSPALVALVLVVAFPALVEAGWLGVRNDTGAPIVVQGASLVNGVPRRGKPQLLFPGEVAWECILIPGNKVIEVYDPKLPKAPALHRETVNCGADDLFYSITIETPPPPPKGQPAQPAKIKLTPTKPPGPPPTRR